MISLKKLTENFGDEKGKKIRDLLMKKTKTRDYTSVQESEKKCFHPMNYKHRLMIALDEILDGYGVEYLGTDNPHYPRFEYVSLGDTYEPTIIHNLETGRIFIDSWGNVAERYKL